MLKSLIDKQEKNIIGLMSGTSVDGIDAALVHVIGSGLNTQLSLTAFETYPFSAAERETILRIASSPAVSLDELTRLNFYLGKKFAQAAEKVTLKAGLELTDIDLIGSHGQTIRHLPQSVPFLEESIACTLQIGDPSVIAKETGVTTVGDFRPADMAVGGQGAPLVPFFDFLFFRSQDKNQVILNIGGIANITLLPSQCSAEQVLAFDTGPGNCLIDLACQTFFSQRYDPEGAIAARGRLDADVLASLLQDDYFLLPPPKSTGREYFGHSFLQRVINLHDHAPRENIITTLTALTAKSIADAVIRYFSKKADEVIASGGGVLNRTLMRLLSEYLNIPILTTDEFGIPSDVKEAVCFAVLANETLCGHFSNLPAATGAARPVVLGKICF